MYKYYPAFVDLATGYTSGSLLYILGEITPPGSTTLTQTLQIAVALSTIAKLAYDVYKSEKGPKPDKTKPLAGKKKKGAANSRTP